MFFGSRLEKGLDKLFILLLLMFYSLLWPKV